MDINIYNSNREKIAIVDNYISLMWCKRYNELGAIDIVIPATAENVSFFSRDNYITRNDDDAVYRIDAVEINTTAENGNTLTIGGSDCRSIIAQRIVWNTINFNGTVENYIRKIINDNAINPTNTNRKINNLQLSTAKGFTETISQQVSYVNLMDKINSICKEFNLGTRVYFENGIFYFDIYRGIDRSMSQTENPRIIFSADYDNLISSKYNMSTADYATTALVGGEGEGIDRKNATAGDNMSDINRYEIFVDKKDASTNSDIPISDSEYTAQLVSAGREAIADNQIKTQFDCEIFPDFYVYKTDYNLGDIVTIDNGYGVRINAQITEIIETWDNSGYRLEPVIKYIETPVVTPAVLLTENNVQLMTESNEIILLENTATITEDSAKISELPEAQTIFDGCCFPIVQNGETKKINYNVLKGTITPDFSIDENGHLIAHYD